MREWRAVCRSDRFYSAFGSFMLYLAESFRVTSSDRRAAGQDISTLEERLAEEAKQLPEAPELLPYARSG
jgi:hypothetical protein